MTPEIESLVEAALAAQERERLDGFGSAHPELDRLRESLEARALIALTAELVSDVRVPVRELGARLLIHVEFDADLVIDAIEQAVATELDPAVNSWHVVALQYTRSFRAMPLIRRFAEDPDPTVRFAAAGAISGCSEGTDQDLRLVMSMCADEDPDVRWSAVFELAAWWSDPDLAALESLPAARRLLVELAAGSDPELARLAGDALEAETN